MERPSPAHRPVASVRELGEQVRNKRKRLGATQAQAADLAGVGLRFLSELERGKESLELGKVLRVLRALGLDVTIRSRGDNGDA